MTMLVEFLLKLPGQLHIPELSGYIQVHVAQVVINRIQQRWLIYAIQAVQLK